MSITRVIDIYRDTHTPLPKAISYILFLVCVRVRDRTIAGKAITYIHIICLSSAVKRS